MRVILTGKETKLGQVLSKLLAEEYANVTVFAPDSTQFDLSIEAEVERMYENAAPGSDTVVIHVAARIGMSTQDRVGRTLYYAILSNALMMEHAMWNKVSKYIVVFASVSGLGYPRWDEMLVDMQRAQTSAYKAQYKFEPELWFPEISGEEKVEARLREYLTPLILLTSSH